MSVITVAQAPNGNVPAFLDLIAKSEGTSVSSATQNSGYDVIVSGVDGQHIFTDYSDHPFAPKFNRKPIIVRQSPLLISTASGRYQVLMHYFEVYKAQLGLPDFSPLSQDLVAIQQMRERGALAYLAAGQIQSAIEACSNIWASLPGNDYGQGGHSMDALLHWWGNLAPQQEVA